MICGNGRNNGDGDTENMQDRNDSEGRGTMEDDVVKTAVYMQEDGNSDSREMGQQ